MTLDTFWKGEAPADVQKRAEEAGAAVGVAVKFIPTELSLEDSLAAMDLIWATARVMGVKLDEVRPTSNYSGLEADVMPGVEADLALLEATLSKVAGISVKVGRGLGAINLTRQNDSSPWQAGAAVQTLSSAACTMGFAATKNGGGDRILSAGHCDDTGNSAWWDATGQVISSGGNLTGLKPHWDSMLIIPDSGNTLGAIYGGPWNNPLGGPRYTLPTVGSGAAVEGQSVCAGGANSGERCPLVTGTTNLTFHCFDGTQDCLGFRVRNPSGGQVAGQGDSGGPIYWPTGNGTMAARGIIATGAPGYSVTCSTNMWQQPAPGLCFSRINVQSTEKLETEWGITIQ